MPGPVVPADPLVPAVLESAVAIVFVLTIPIALVAAPSPAVTALLAVAFPVSVAAVPVAALSVPPPTSDSEHPATTASAKITLGHTPARWL
jgi:hypothetical protein